MTERTKLALCVIALALGISAYATAMSHYHYPAHQCRPQRMM